MMTSDEHYVSGLTLMCEHHSEQALNMIAQVLDSKDRQPEHALEDARRYLAEERAVCIETCGRADDVR